MAAVDLPVELDTPVFARIYARYCDQTRIRNVERVEWPSADEFRERIVPAGYPVVMRFNQPALSESIFESLAVHYGHLRLQVRDEDYAAPLTYAHERKYVELTLADYLADLKVLPLSKDETDVEQSGSPASKVPPRYAGNQPLSAEVAGLVGISPPPFYPAHNYEPPAFWLGGPGSITPLHKDSTDNFAFHVLGQKRWTLFPPRDVPFLAMTRPKPDDAIDFATSSIDLRQPDPGKHPQFSEAVPVTVVVSGSEMLYLPAGWGHFVETIQTSLMVNFWLGRDAFRALWLGAS